MIETLKIFFWPAAALLLVVLLAWWLCSDLRPIVTVGFYFVCVDNVGTYKIAGALMGDTVFQWDATGKTVSVSNNGGYFRLTLTSFSHPSGAGSCNGSVRIL